MKQKMPPTEKPKNKNGTEENKSTECAILRKYWEENGGKIEKITAKKSLKQKKAQIRTGEG